MNETKTIKYLRFSYWTGAIVDTLVLIPMHSSTAGSAMLGIADFNPGPDYRYAMGIGASLMCGWVFLLLWADRKPLERKGVLLLTVIPVLVGLILSGVYAITSQWINANRMIPTWIMQGLLVLLFGISYLKARAVSTPAFKESSNMVVRSTN
jgi:hypothetical protein